LLFVQSSRSSISKPVSGNAFLWVAIKVHIIRYSVASGFLLLRANVCDAGFLFTTNFLQGLLHPCLYIQLSKIVYISKQDLGIEKGYSFIPYSALDWGEPIIWVFCPTYYQNPTNKHICTKNSVDRI
jgi:hypothetical protein